jgi:alkylation response protein AidB-like acyl-CoA dehydrogenase
MNHDPMIPGRPWGARILDFRLTEDQTLLGEAVERLVREQYGFEVRQAAIASEAGWNREFWTQLAELGILGAPLPEQAGGLGGAALATMLVMRAFGAGLVVAPYLSTIVCAATLIARAGSSAQQQSHLPAIIRGEQIFAFASAEHGDRGILANIRTTAVRDGSRYRITGQKALVVGAPWADWIIVVARLAGARTEPGALGAFIVSPQAKGLTARPARTIDGLLASEITFEGVTVDAGSLIGPGHGVGSEIEQIVDEAIVALCAEASGALDTLLAMTVEYSKVRKQFGQPIGRFQVLQHRMVDMLIGREQAQAIVHRASLCLTADARTRQRAVSACKAQVGRIGTQVAQAAVQTHGAIGTTEESAVSHYFRRLAVINMQFGDVDDHVNRYAELLDA